MALRALFKKQEEKNREAQRKLKAPMIIDDDDEDFKGLSSAKASGNGRAARASTKRKRIDDDSDSEEDVGTAKHVKKKTSSCKVTLPRMSQSSEGGTKKLSATPIQGKGKKEIKSLTDFFGKAPVKRTTRSTRNDRGGEKSGKLGKQKVGDDGGQEVRTVPESPTEAAVMEFSDEAVALALQEEELEMQKKKERQIHEDEKFSQTLSALDNAETVERSSKTQPSPSRPPAKKLKLMMDKVPVSQSPSKSPKKTPTKEKKRQPPKTMASELKKGTVVAGHSQHTTSWGTRGGVRYFDEDADEEDFKVERKRSKPSPKPSPKVSPSKHDSRASSSRSPVGQRTTPPSGRAVTTPTKVKSARTAPVRTQTTPSKETTSKAGRGTTPKKSTPQPGPSPSSTVGSVSGSGTTPSMSRAQSFLRYKNRAGPRAPGSKEIPEGAENCLEGLTFVITGVLESLEREEIVDIIKKYGGKVTTSISGRTSYVVVGEEAGESKLAKARQAGTKQIDEDGFLDLIRTLPAPEKTAGKKTTAVAAKSKAKAKSKSKSPSPAMLAPTKSHDSSPAKAIPSLSHMTSKPSTSGLSAPPIPEVGSLLWVDKYRPQSTRSIIG